MTYPAEIQGETFFTRSSLLLLPKIDILHGSDATEYNCNANHDRRDQSWHFIKVDEREENDSCHEKGNEIMQSNIDWLVMQWIETSQADSNHRLVTRSSRMLEKEDQLDDQSSLRDERAKRKFERKVIIREKFVLPGFVVDWLHKQIYTCKEDWDGNEKGSDGDDPDVGSLF